MKDRLRVAARLSFVIFGTACAGGDPVGEGETRVREVSNDILNGTPWPNGFGDGRFVLLKRTANSGEVGGACSATLLRGRPGLEPAIVLTARHCVHKTASVTDLVRANFMKASQLSVVPEAGGASLPVATYKAMTTHDVAILLLNGSPQLGGSYFGGFTQITGRTRNATLGFNVWCAGRGVVAATLAQCKAGQGTVNGLNGMWNIAQPSSNADQLIYNVNNGQVPSNGDSGSSCAFTNTANTVWEALDVNSWRSGACTAYGNPPQYATPQARYVAAQAFRNFASDRYWDWVPATNDPFTANSLGSYTQFQEPGTTGGAMHWWWWDAGTLVQDIAMSKWFGTVLTGTDLILGQRPVSVGMVQANIRSNDTGVAGVIFGWQDPTHYYRFTAHQANGVIQFAKRSGNTFTVLNSATRAIDWVPGHNITVFIGTDASFSARIDNVDVLTASDPLEDYLDGYTGVTLANMGTVSGGAYKWVVVDNFIEGNLQTGSFAVDDFIGPPP